MENVFDLIDEFYEQDFDWNEALSRDDAEGYLRTRIMDGADEDELLIAWENINCYCLYAGHTEAYLGDLDGDDIIDCIAWCARNISGFKADEGRVTVFLHDLTGLYEYMHKKKKVRSIAAPLEAMETLFPDDYDGMLVIDENGNFLPGYERYEEVSSPDLPQKIYFKIGVLVDKTMNVVANYFYKKDEYKNDIARARYMFGDYAFTVDDLDKEQREEYEKCFWEYFVLDYHMLHRFVTPLEMFSELVDKGEAEVKSSSISDMLKELHQAEMVLFSIEEPVDEGTVRCRNFLTGEEYFILMDSSNVKEYKGMLFLGHIFYNKTICLSVVRGHNIKNSSKKVLFDILSKAKNWVSVRYGGELSWFDFIKIFPIFVRHSILFYSSYVRMDRFDYKTNISEYMPQPILDDAVSSKLKKIMASYFFSSLDVELVQTLWSDYQHITGEKAVLPDVWAAGVLQTFVELNSVYTYDIRKISEISGFIPVDAVKRASESIKDALAIEKYDPRYVNEESLLMMALQ